LKGIDLGFRILLLGIGAALLITIGYLGERAARLEKRVGEIIPEVSHLQEISYRVVDYRDPRPYEEAFRKAGSQELEILLAWWDRETGSREVTVELLVGALGAGVPVSLAFALAWGESRYHPGAVGRRNADGSLDYGLLQLNDRQFRKEREELLDLKGNVRLGLAHLRECYEKYGSWEGALVVYNLGRLDRVPVSTVNHVVGMLGWEREKGLGALEERRR